MHFKRKIHFWLDHFLTQMKLVVLIKIWSFSYLTAKLSFPFYMCTHQWIKHFICSCVVFSGYFKVYLSLNSLVPSLKSSTLLIWRIFFVFLIQEHPIHCKTLKTLKNDYIKKWLYDQPKKLVETINYWDTWIFSLHPNTPVWSSTIGAGFCFVINVAFLTASLAAHAGSGGSSHRQSRVNGASKL